MINLSQLLKVRKLRPFDLEETDLSQALSAKAIANFFLEKENMSPMKLLKLVYFAHGWHLATSGEPLIKEDVEAWEFGPVIPSLYHEFKKFGNQPITSKATEFSWESEDEEEVPTPKSPEVLAVLEKVWCWYGKYSPTQLANETHLPGTPWDLAVKANKAQNDGELGRHVVIPNSLIKRYFVSSVKQ